nr:PREDICTED: caskin-1 [Latimeria chalumnae]|eukprot:XP_014350949.1 PREDICTED: caskin-1 [Latimeria chalumnae]
MTKVEQMSISSVLDMYPWIQACSDIFEDYYKEEAEQGWGNGAFLFHTIVDWECARCIIIYDYPSQHAVMKLFVSECLSSKMLSSVAVAGGLFSLFMNQNNFTENFRLLTGRVNKSAEAVFQWLSEFQLQVYAQNFISAGYDIPTISRMTPEDLTAIGVTKPGHRKKITSEINNLNVTEWLPEHKPADLGEWLSMIGLGQYYKTLVYNGYENIEFITDITWEDLQEIGITKLGHQKKLMLAVKKLAELQKAEHGKYDSGTLKKKTPQTLEVVAIESPQQETAECQSPKMTTFQDSELSNELQVALATTGEVQDNHDIKKSNHVSHSREGMGYGSQGPRSVHENNLSGKAKQISSSQELLGEGSKVSSAAMSKSQEYLPDKVREGGHRSSISKEVRPLRHSQGQVVQKASVPPVPGKPRQSFPPAGGVPTFTPPQTPTKPRPSSPQTLIVPQATAKVKPTPQLLQQADRPMSPRSLPQSPTHKGFAYVMPQPIEVDGSSHIVGPSPQGVPVLPVSVPVLCLPPQGDDTDEDPARPKKRAHSLNRYAMSDSEQERDELLIPDAIPYATVQRRVGRSHSVRAQSSGDKNVNRSQSFAIRPKKKGPPPPPPKRSSSAISSTNLADDFSKEKEVFFSNELDVKESFKEQRRASDFTGSVETGSVGSVKSIAAMLEMSSIGGGARALALQRSLGGGRPLEVNYLHVGNLGRPGSPEHSRVATVLATVKHRDAIGLDGEIVNRRRTISGPVTGLIAAARRERSDSVKSVTEKDLPKDKLQVVQADSSQNSSSENLPFAEEGNLTIKQRPKQGGPVKPDTLESGPLDQVQSNSTAFHHESLSKLEATATIKRRGKSKQNQQQDVKFRLIESDTVKRRPKSKDQMGLMQDSPHLMVFQNGTGTIRRRPVSEMSGTELSTPQASAVCDGISSSRRDSVEYGTQTTDGETKKQYKPPVSPKPVLAQQAVVKKQGPPTPTSKKAPIPSPGSPEVKRAQGTPPPVSPKPTPPPTAPKPLKSHAVLQSVSAGSTPTPSPAKQPTTIKAASTPASVCSSPAKPITAGQSQQVPVKPPRSSISGLSTESASTEIAHQKLEETSASLAAALQAVEEKIKEDVGQKIDSAESKSTVSILDDIGSMFDDLADQLDAMLE